MLPFHMSACRAPHRCPLPLVNSLRVTRGHRRQHPESIPSNAIDKVLNAIESIKAHLQSPMDEFVSRAQSYRYNLIDLQLLANDILVELPGGHPPSVSKIRRRPLQPLWTAASRRQQGLRNAVSN